MTLSNAHLLRDSRKRRARFDVCSERAQSLCGHVRREYLVAHVAENAPERTVWGVIHLKHVPRRPITPVERFGSTAHFAARVFFPQVLVTMIATNLLASTFATLIVEAVRVRAVTSKTSNRLDKTTGGTPLLHNAHRIMCTSLDPDACARKCDDCNLPGDRIVFSYDKGPLSGATRRTHLGAGWLSECSSVHTFGPRYLSAQVSGPR